MKISILLESTSDDLYRKIDALDAMIKDTATTTGEKENAAALKQKIEAKLAKMFPGAKRPEKVKATDTSYSSGFGNNDFWAGMAKAAKDAQDLEDLKQNDPEAYRQRMEAKLKTMQDKLARMRKYHLSGNVETAYQIKQYAAEVERFLAREFPEKYAEIVAKRDEANYKAFQARSKKKADKEKAAKDAVKKSGKLTWKEQGKTYEPALKALYDQLVGLEYRPYGYKSVVGQGIDKWKSGDKFMISIIQMPMGEIRKAWNKLTPEYQQDLRDAVEGTNTMGYKQQGYTAAQQKAILNAMSPYKNPKVK